MKKLFVAAAVIAVSATGALGAATAAEANNGWAKGNPGNSAWGRSHNPNYAPVMWGGQSFTDLEALIERLRSLLAALRAGQGYATSTASAVDVTTNTATNVRDDRATLRGTVDLEGEDRARVWFEYGTREGGPLRRTAALTVEDEDGDRVSFDVSVRGLREDTQYFFRAIAADDAGIRDYGSRVTFTTRDDDDDDDDEDEDRDEDEDDDRDDEAPEVETGATDDVDDTSATLLGEVDMNDFENGVVFFVYGEDENAIEDVADDFDTYAEVDEDGDNLRKLRADSDLDGAAEYEASLEELDENTKYFYALAVEYEDEDGEDVIVLGDVRSFTTD